MTHLDKIRRWVEKEKAIIQPLYSKWLENLYQKYPEYRLNDIHFSRFKVSLWDLYDKLDVPSDVLADLTSCPIPKGWRIEADPNNPYVSRGDGAQYFYKVFDDKDEWVITISEIHSFDYMLGAWDER